LDKDLLTGGRRGCKDEDVSRRRFFSIFSSSLFSSTKRLDPSRLLSGAVDWHDTDGIFFRYIMTRIAYSIGEMVAQHTTLSYTVECLVLSYDVRSEESGELCENSLFLQQFKVQNKK